MNADLFKVKNAKFQMAIFNGTELVGFAMALQFTELLANGKDTMIDCIGLFDLYREPLNKIVADKLNVNLGLNGNVPHIIDASGNVYNYTFFEELSKRTQKATFYQLNNLDAGMQTYLKQQATLFNENIVSRKTEPSVNVQQAPPQPNAFNPRPEIPQTNMQPLNAVAPQQPTPQPTPSNVASTIPQPTPVTQNIQQPTPVQPTPVQPTPVQPVQVQPEPIAPQPRPNDGKTYSNDEFPVGTRNIYSCIDRTTKLPEFKGTDAQGNKLYGPDKYTEEECLALIQISKLVGRTGEHLLTPQERKLFEDQMGGIEGDTEITQALNIIAGAQNAVLQQIQTERMQKRNVIDLRDRLVESLKTGCPYEIMGTRFSFKYMAPVDENGELLEGKGHPLIRERVKQMLNNGETITNTISTPMPTPNIQQTQPINRPRPQTQANPQSMSTAQTPTPFTQGVAGSGFAKPQPVTQQPNPQATLTCIVRKFITTDGSTIEGIIFDAEGTLQGRRVSGKYMQSLAKLQSSYTGVKQLFNFTNASLVMVSGKLEIHMTDSQLNLIDVVPSKRFEHPANVDIPYLLSKDTVLAELKLKPQYAVNETQAVPQQPEVVVPQQGTAPQTTPHSNWNQATMDKVVEHTHNQPIQPQKELSESAKQFLKFVEEQQGKLSVTGFINGSMSVVIVDAEELKTLLNI